MKLYGILILLFVSCVAASHSFQNGSNEPTFCIEKERQALLAFRAGLRLTRDIDNLPSWSAKDCCKWSEVECSNKTSHVIKLVLQNYRFLVSKSNPDSLLELQELKYLDFSYISFEYIPFPTLFGSLSQLEYLRLSYCDFTGIIPSQLGNLSNLNHLVLVSSLDTNLSVESIDWLSRLSSLETLYLENIDLSRATNWVDKVTSLPFLSDLTFNNCSLSKVVSPSSKNFSSSTSIKKISLASNGFTSAMYSWLFNLSSTLVDLTLRDNILNGHIFEEFGDYMPYLQNLDLSSNLLQGMIPNSFRSLSNLVSLDIQNNNLSGNVSDFVDILSAPTLEKLYADNNKFYGPLPDGIIKFSSLSDLSMSFNQLNGTFSKNLATLSKLQYLDLSSNSLSGIVSETHFSNLSDLKHLDLSLNRLQVHVSPQWFPSFQLSEIRLSSCSLGPSFPNWIRSQKSIWILDLSNNGISDNIPPWFWDLCSMCQNINLSSNNIGGTLPNFQATMLLQIDLSSNNFEGPIPLFPSFMTLSINLSRNRFSGTLSFLCQLHSPSLSFLDISNNLLSGRLPDCWGNLTELIVINLAHNGLFGEIPSSLGSLSQLETLYLYKNSFSGELPLSLSSCERLSFLDVGENRLTGIVPAWIGGNLLHLKILSLQTNNFSGTIPLELCQLNKLRVLDLSSNNLLGSIPSCLNNISAMVHKELVKPLDHNYGISFGAGFRPINFSGIYEDYSMIGWQGRELEFGKNLRLLKLIDLSNNKLIGEIPNEITELVELVALNLSRNELHGNVPLHIGQMKSILSLDFSRNRFSGKIPASLSQLSSLNYLDLSYNDLSGEIPTSTQLQSFDASKFTGNVGLCGRPLTSICPKDASPTSKNGSEDNGENHEENEFLKWLYIGLASGFVSGFWGICGVLFLYRRSRHAFFLFVDELIDWFYVKMKIAARRF